MLGTCLEAACQEGGETTSKIRDLQNEIEEHETTVLLLSIKIELQRQFQEAQLKERKLRERVEVMLMQAPRSPDIVQIRKLIVSPEEWDDNIWGDKSNDGLDEDDNLCPPEPPQYTARPIIETEEIFGPEGGVADCTRKIIPLFRSVIFDPNDQFARRLLPETE